MSRKKDEATKRRLVIYAANKGGVGKSMLCRAHIDIARAANRNVAAYDLDAANGSVARLYSDRDPMVGAGIADITVERDSSWLDVLDSSADDVVYDVPGGKMDALLRTFTGGGEAFAEYVAKSNRELVIVSPIGVKKDALHTITDAITAFGSSMKAGTTHHVIVKNGFFGDDSDFLVFDGYDDNLNVRRFGKLRDRALEYNAQIVWIPRLSPAADALADQLDLTFALASESGEGAPLSRRHAYNISQWLTIVSATLSETWASPLYGGVSVGIS